jgi:hypothetical protein
MFMLSNVGIHLNSFCQWVEAMRKFQDTGKLVDSEQCMKKSMLGQFWSSHQRFFKYLCIAAKVTEHNCRFAFYF